MSFTVTSRRWAGWYHASADKADSAWQVPRQQRRSLQVVGWSLARASTWQAAERVATLFRSTGSGRERGHHGVSGKPCYAVGDVRDEAHVPAQPHPAPAVPRLPSTDEDEERPRHHQAAAGEGSPAAGRLGSLQVGRNLATAPGGLSGSDRLLRPRDFRRVAREGGRSASSSFVVLASRAAAGERKARLGITASRRVGSAVVRNRVKRQIREWFRAERGGVGAADIVVIARPRGARLDSKELREELSSLVRQALSNGG